MLYPQPVVITRGLNGLNQIANINLTFSGAAD